MNDDDPFGGDDPLNEIQPAPTPPNKPKVSKRDKKDTHDDLGVSGKQMTSDSKVSFFQNYR